MPHDTQYSQPLFFNDFKIDADVKKLKRLPFTKNALEPSTYDEAWLQRLIMRQPELLPIDQIEPAFAGLVPICMELPTSSSGFLDNLLITPNGNIALIECKLWRNQEARRQVIAQIIDYANTLSALTYVKLEEAIDRSRPLTGANERVSLYELVSSASEINEASFVDAVSRNLRLGRFLLLIVGDGIREEMESMVEFLQQHAGLHFTFAIAEIALFELPTGGYIAQPRVLVRTKNIDRGVVSFDGGRIAIGPAVEATKAVNSPVRRMTITRESFIEELENNLPGISEKLNAFIDKLPAYNVVVEFGAHSLILRWHPDTTVTWNLATIPTHGDLWLNYVTTEAINRSMLPLSKKYLQALADLVPEASVRKTPKDAGWYVSLHGRNVKVDALLADERRADGWLRAIAEFQAGVAKPEKAA